MLSVCTHRRDGNPCGDHSAIVVCGRRECSTFGAEAHRAAPEEPSMKAVICTETRLELGDIPAPIPARVRC